MSQKPFSLHQLQISYKILLILFNAMYFFVNLLKFIISDITFKDIILAAKVCREWNEYH